MEKDSLRQRIGKIIWGQDARFGSAFDQTMAGVILVSIFGLSLSTVPGLPAWTQPLLNALDVIVLLLFTSEYLLRLWTARDPMRYARSFWGVIDLLAILPFWQTIGGNFQALRSPRLLRILRIGKLARHVAALDRITRTFQLIKDELIVFGFLALIVMFIAAVGIYEFEHDAQPEAFASIPHALWFVVVTLTTVGCGDIYPITLGGRFFTVFILIIGLGVIAVPTGLISSGLSRAREEEKERKRGRQEQKPER